MAEQEKHADPLQSDEERVWEREQELVELEAQMHTQEQGVIEMERALRKRADALNNLLAYMADQERSLLERAEAIGPRARAAVASRIEQQEGEAEGGAFDVSNIGLVDERRTMLERREELLETRRQFIEERESLYQERTQELERTESRINELEERLLAREKENAEVLRQLITRTTDFVGEEGDGEAASASGDEAAGEQPAAESGSGGEQAEVTGEQDESGKTGGARRQGKRVQPETRQVRYDLNARVGEAQQHHFFRYEDDDPDELPGFFVATEQLLKEDREVLLGIDLDGEQTVEAKGIVSWRNKPGEEDPPGMGIELTWIEEEGKQALDRWLASNPPDIL